MFPVWLFTLLVAGVVGALLVIALFTISENRTANRTLASLICIAIGNQVVVAIGFHSSEVFRGWVQRAVFPFSLLNCALFYLYFRSLTSTGRFLSRHLLPFALGAGWSLVFWIWNGSLPRSRYLYTVELIGRSLMVIAAMGIYFVAAWAMLQKIERELPQVVSQPHHLRLRWLKLILGVSLPLAGAACLQALTGPLAEVLVLRSIALSIALACLVVFALKHSSILSELRAVSKKAGTLPSHAAGEQAAWQNRLEKLFAEERPYLDAELKLSELAQRMGLKPSELSSLLNQGLRTTFFDYVNRHRVQEVQRRLRDPAYRHLSILGIAMDSGFNSKSAFSVAFRKWTGETPSGYRSRSEPAPIVQDEKAS